MAMSAFSSADDAAFLLDPLGLGGWVVGAVAIAAIAAVDSISAVKPA